MLNSSGTVLATLATFSNLNAASGYQQHSYSLSSYAGPVPGETTTRLTWSAGPLGAPVQN